MKSTLLLAFAFSGAVFVAIDPLHFFRDVVAHAASVVIVMALGISDYLRKRLSHGEHKAGSPTPPPEEAKDL